MPAILLPASRPEAPRLDHDQLALIDVASTGARTEQAAEKLDCTAGEVEDMRDMLIVEFSVPNMAAVVYQAIRSGQLNIEIPSQERGTSLRNQTILSVIAEGGTNANIAARLSEIERKPVNKDKARTYSRMLFSKLHATGRTHSVRLGFENGYFALPDNVLAEREPIKS